MTGTGGTVNGGCGVDHRRLDRPELRADRAVNPQPCKET